MNWPFDDQPIWMRTRTGPLLYVPYSTEINDLPVLINTWRYTPRQFAELIIDQFDEMLEESRRRPLVFCFSLHTFVLGHPFRIRPLRQAMQHIMKHRDDIWLTTPGRDRHLLQDLAGGDHSRQLRVCCSDNPRRPHGRGKTGAGLYQTSMNMTH